MRRTWTTVAISGVFLLVPLGVADAAPAAPFRNCAAAAASGYTDIPRGMFGYAARLDGNSNGIACEQGGGTGTGTAARFEDGSAVTAQAVSSSSSGPVSGSDADGQVSVVPDGGAPTGDGSTAADTPAWVAGAGGLLAMLVGLAAVLGLRRRAAAP